MDWAWIEWDQRDQICILKLKCWLEKYIRTRLLLYKLVNITHSPAHNEWLTNHELPQRQILKLYTKQVPIAHFHLLVVSVYCIAAFGILLTDWYHCITSVDAIKMNVILLFKLQIVAWFDWMQYPRISTIINYFPFLIYLHVFYHLELLIKIRTKRNDLQPLLTQCNKIIGLIIEQRPLNFLLPKMKGFVAKHYRVVEFLGNV